MNVNEVETRVDNLRDLSFINMIDIITDGEVVVGIAIAYLDTIGIGCSVGVNGG